MDLYTKYLNEIEIARQKINDMKLYPAGVILCDFYVLPPHDHQAYYVMISAEKNGWSITYVKTKIYSAENPGVPVLMRSFADCLKAEDEKLSGLNGQFYAGVKNLPEAYIDLLTDIAEMLPDKYISPDSEICIDGVFQAMRLFKDGAITKEILYRKADRIPLQKRDDALIKSLDSLYIEIENIID